MARPVVSTSESLDCGSSVPPPSKNLDERGELLVGVARPAGGPRFRPRGGCTARCGRGCRRCRWRPAAVPEFRRRRATPAPATTRPWRNAGRASGRAIALLHVGHPDRGRRVRSAARRAAPQTPADAASARYHRAVLGLIFAQDSTPGRSKCLHRARIPGREPTDPARLGFGRSTGSASDPESIPRRGLWIPALPHAARAGMTNSEE